MPKINGVNCGAAPSELFAAENGRWRADKSG